jgi:glycosyltransferase involved in cell wall biosynthesis
VKGLARELAARGVDIQLVGGRDEMLSADYTGPGRVELYDFVGSLEMTAGFPAKIARVAAYFVRLLRFTWRSDARLFHVLWFRRFPRLERLLLTTYLRFLGKKLVLTAHNVDDRARDGVDGGILDRVSLRVVYRNAHHVFVHTTAMKQELRSRFGLPQDRVTVVPLGLNDVIPVSTATRAEARDKLGLHVGAKILLFFGNIAPYKGLEDLVCALGRLVQEDPTFFLIIAGRVKNNSCVGYWREVEELIDRLKLVDHVFKQVRYVPDDEVGLLFRAADVSVLPYRRVYQSGVLGLSYAQRLPVIAADVGAMRDDISPGKTGFLFVPGDPVDLARTIRTYFASDVFRDLESKGAMLSDHGAERFSWSLNADRTCAVYRSLLQ